ncbi:MAG: PD-(D/E)XK nuclease family protein [Flavobacteriales bacterium]
MNKTHSITLRSQTFLEDVANILCQHEKPEKCAVVLPSFRAVNAFKRAFAKVVGKPCRMPKVMTLGAFMEGDESFSLAENLEVLARLYAVQVHLPEGRDGFTSFLNWGPIALSDFHAIDHHLKDALAVFKNLRDIKEIEEWSFAPDQELTEDQIIFMKQWDRLPTLYTKLHEVLSEDGLVTKAKLSRKVAEEGKTNGYDMVYAAGLAALTGSELLYMKKWRAAGKLSYLPDADQLYVEDGQMEAGYFIRDIHRDIQSPSNFIKSRIQEKPPKIKIVECSSVMSSCQYVRQIVSELSDDEKGKTVIVLPDASTLPMLLQALPYCKDGYNVTMGLSIRETPIHPFINLVNRMTTRKGQAWRYEDLMALSSQQIANDYRKDAAHTLHILAEKHAVWVSDELLKEVSKGPFYAFVSDLRLLKTDQADKYLKELGVWTEKLGKQLENEENPWVKAGWNCVRRVVSVMGRLQSKHNPCKTSEDVRMLMQKLLSIEKVNLLGEPAKGLQIMGLTETRALDYDRVIVLDCNEGAMPKQEIIDSYIPVDLQNNLGFPGRHEREAAYAYSLYRLLNRSSEMHLLHRTGGKDGVESSRYILQLKKQFETELFTFNMPLPDKRPEIPGLELNDFMKERFHKWMGDGMSPSAINKMLTCERNFTYRYLLKLSEPTDLEESIQSNTLGSIVHKVFEEGLKKTALNVTLNESHLKDILSQVDELLADAIAEEYKYGPSDRGENFLLIRSARSTIKKILQREISELNKDGCHITITGLEEQIDATYTLKDGSEIKFFGMADRVEKIDGVTRVVDYKTGQATQSELNLKDSNTGDWDGEEGKLNRGKASKALQLLVYCAMLLKRDENLEVVNAAIRSGRNVHSGLLTLTINDSKDITKNDVDRFLDWIGMRLASFRKDGKKISHNEESHYCEYCVILDPPVISY